MDNYPPLPNFQLWRWERKIVLIGLKFRHGEVRSKWGERANTLNKREVSRQRNNAIRPPLSPVQSFCLNVVTACCVIWLGFCFGESLGVRPPHGSDGEGWESCLSGHRTGCVIKSKGKQDDTDCNRGSTSLSSSLSPFSIDLITSVTLLTQHNGSLVY